MVCILAVESSCDETSVAIVRDGCNVLANVVASQMRSHMRFGGVVPEIASRHHVAQITQVAEQALVRAAVSWETIDAVAVTAGPGLVGALLIGITAAKAMAFAHGKPLIAVNHLAGHIYAAQLEAPLQFPLMALVVSGGHTELVLMRQHGVFDIIGETRDDAVGEAYDKVGRVLHLPYPGGKALDELAHRGRETYALPRAMIHEDHYDFSFSGLKSAVINLVHNAEQRGETIAPENLACSFQASVVDTLVSKTMHALNRYAVRQLLVVGGVAANQGLRAAMAEQLAQHHPEVSLRIPPLSLCGDNAAMIGAAALHQYTCGDWANSDLNAYPNWGLGEARE